MRRSAILAVLCASLVVSAPAAAAPPTHHQIIHLDENGEVISIDIVGGNFDPFEGADAIICGALA
jgi:hypothetical protein